DQDQVGIERLLLRLQLLGLAAADEIARIGAFDARGQLAHDGCAGRARELAEFLEGEGIGMAGFVRLQQQRAFTASGSFEQGDSPCGEERTGCVLARDYQAPSDSPCSGRSGVPGAPTCPSGPPTRTLREGTTV